MSTAKARLKAGIRRATSWARKPRPVILMYHRIGRETFDPWGLAVEQDRFAAQLEWLATNRSLLALTDFMRLHQERNLPHDGVSLTFDDGYESILQAVPVLDKHGVQATVFLPAELIERGRDFWWDELAKLIIGWQGDTAELGGDRVLVPRAHAGDRTWRPHTPPRTRRQKLFQSIWSRLHAMCPAALDVAMTELREQARNVEPNATDRPLTPEQVRSVSSTAIAFGSHGLNHPSLPALSHEEKVREITESRARCAALTGTVPTAFAYPFGEWDVTSRRLVEEAGYACACATGDSFVTRRSEAFALPRFNVGNWEPRRMRDMLCG
jgi:peptidoglycan/xylan/chitin deacetylase (PgdA/CDA1 family)